jgi:peptidylprolyl isomerase
VNHRTAAIVGICAASLLLGVAGPALAQQPPARPSATPSRPAPAPPAAPAPVTTQAAPASAPTGSGGDIIAQAGASKVTAGEARAYVEQLGLREKAAIARDPRLLSQALRTILANQLVLQEAVAKKWDQQPAIAAQLERIRQEALVETYLRSMSTPPSGFPSDSDIETVYESNKTAFLMPRQYQVAQILVAVAANADKDAEDKARKKLDDLQRKLKTPGADFAALARAESDDRDSATNGGELGWLPETQLRTEIRAQIVGLATKAVSEAVRLDDGWHIFKLLDTKAAHTRPLAEVKDQLTQRIREERAAALRRTYLAKVLEQSPPAINELALSKLVSEAVSSTPSR